MMVRSLQMFQLSYPTAEANKSATFFARPLVLLFSYVYTPGSQGAHILNQCVSSGQMRVECFIDRF